VEETAAFATNMKLPRYPSECFENPKTFAMEMTDSILSALGISHTKKTIVGNEFVRGVSGGERKRVSIAEVMATQVCRRPSLFTTSGQCL
jgi:ABC-type multidrug transport system ATPase subunit